MSFCVPIWSAGTAGNSWKWRQFFAYLCFIRSLSQLIYTAVVRNRVALPAMIMADVLRTFFWVQLSVGIFSADFFLRDFVPV